MEEETVEKDNNLGDSVKDIKSREEFEKEIDEFVGLLP